MQKVKIGPQTLLYPKPALLIGALVDGKPNFMTVAWAGIANMNPPMLSMAIRAERYTYKGISKNRTFSVNIPSQDQAKETDYCGIISGSRTDKVADCGFSVFYGEMKTAPMIGECPVNLECSLQEELKFDTHVLCVGRIEEVHVSEGCLTEGKPDVSKIRPLVFATGVERAYYKMGERLATAYQVGRQVRSAE